MLTASFPFLPTHVNRGGEEEEDALDAARASLKTPENMFVEKHLTHQMIPCGPGEMTRGVQTEVVIFGVCFVKGF